MTDPLRTDLNDFLFTAIASDANGMHLTMLSALARSGADPWAEAAGLAALSRETATQKIVLMLAGVSNGPSPGDETANLAARLVAKLHDSSAPKLKPVIAPVAENSTAPKPMLSFAALSNPVKVTIYSLATLIIIMGFRALAS
jgi:hypothetical protein